MSASEKSVVELQGVLFKNFKRIICNWTHLEPTFQKMIVIEMTLSKQTQIV